MFILKKLHKTFPEKSFVYLADKAHFPYGEKASSVVRSAIRKNVQFLADQGAELVVAACNTADACLKEQNIYPVPVTGVISASLKQANKDSKNKKVGLLATEGTVRSQAFLRKAKELNFNLQIHQQACPLLAPFIEQKGWKIKEIQTEKEIRSQNINTEKDNLMKNRRMTKQMHRETKREYNINPKNFQDKIETQNNTYIQSNTKNRNEKIAYINKQHEMLSFLLKKYLQPLVNKEVDTIILGCTHYLYLKSAIEQYLKKDKKVVGPMNFLIQSLLKKEVGRFDFLQKPPALLKQAKRKSVMNENTFSSQDVSVSGSKKTFLKEKSVLDRGKASDYHSLPNIASSSKVSFFISGKKDEEFEKQCYEIWNS